MQRRTFLGSIAAAVGVGGMLFLSQWERLSQRRRLRAVEEWQEKWTPPPRWEWEVGEWHSEEIQETVTHGCSVLAWRFTRDWIASTTMVVFSEEWEPISDAVLACNKTAFYGATSGHIRVEHMDSQYIGNGLAECRIRLRELLHSCAQERKWTRTRLVNFYDIFRGSHAVVIDACEQHIRAHGFTCPRCAEPS